MIFVSYSWIKENPDKKVLELVAKLRENGYPAICDVMETQEKSAINFNEMMAMNLEKAEKVIVVLSKNYKEKADSFRGGVGEEYRYIISKISEDKKKYILVSFDNNITLVQPDFLTGRQIVILSNNNGFSTLLYKLNDLGKYEFPEVNPNKTKPPVVQLTGNGFLNESSLLNSQISNTRQDRYNFFVAGDEEAWESDFYIMPRDRCLTSFASSEIKLEFSLLDETRMNRIKSYPSIFAYEESLKRDAYVGYVTNMSVRDVGIKFYFKKVAKISYNDLCRLAFELDIKLPKGITELMRTHWTIKEVDLKKELLISGEYEKFIDELFSQEKSDWVDKKAILDVDLEYLFSSNKIKSTKNNISYNIWMEFWNKLRDLNEIFINANIKTKKNPDTLEENLAEIGNSVLDLVSYYNTNCFDLELFKENYEMFNLSWNGFIVLIQKYQGKQLTIEMKRSLGNKLQSVRDANETLIMAVRRKLD